MPNPQEIASKHIWNTNLSKHMPYNWHPSNKISFHIKGLVSLFLDQKASIID